MILLGMGLALVGYLLDIGIVELLAVILIVLGLVFLVAGHAGHPVAGRYWW